ncbi:hypothetical protein, partial [Mesorhizobium sp. M7A.F.Ca.AU.001.01.1.1]|uniref:hypothetical protein n=1 Tax=Mesorhizobium sp. M7A.F.Ca.AU.001.01.1.1 TaxID=2496675 RepID=UPI0019D4BE17
FWGAHRANMAGITQCSEWAMFFFRAEIRRHRNHTMAGRKCLPLGGSGGADRHPTRNVENT